MAVLVGLTSGVSVRCGFAASSAAANSSMVLIFFGDDLVTEPTTVADEDHVTKVGICPIECRALQPHGLGTRWIERRPY